MSIESKQQNAGEPRVHVLELNLDFDRSFQTRGQS